MKLKLKAKDAVADAMTDKNLTWYSTKSADRKRGWKVFRELPESVVLCRQNQSTPWRDILVRGRLEQSLEELGLGYNCETTADQRIVAANLNGDRFVDSAVLSVMEGATDEDPFHYFGIKWLALRLLDDHVFFIRDFTYVEFSGTTCDEDGRRVLYKVMQSIDLKMLDALNDDTGFVRGNVSYVYLYREEEDGGVRLMMKGQLDPQGNAPLWIIKKSIDNIHLGPCSESGRVNANFMHLVDSDQDLTVRHKKATSCSLCDRGFSLFRKRSHCRRCGESVCGRCMIKLDKNHLTRGLANLFASGSEKFCIRCYSEARNRRPSMVGSSRGFRFREHALSVTNSSTLSIDSRTFNSISGDDLDYTETESRERTPSILSYDNSYVNSQRANSLIAPTRRKSSPDLQQLERMEHSIAFQKYLLGSLYNRMGPESE